jgi:PAS domain S-box-containing protein
MQPLLFGLRFCRLLKTPEKELTMRKKKSQKQPPQPADMDHQAEEALRESEARFKGLLEYVPDAIIIINSQGKIRFLNAQVKKIFGYNQNELLGKTIETLIPERFHSQHIAQRADFFSTLRTRQMNSGLELYALRKDGSEFPVDISLSHHTIDGEVVVLASIRDITESKRMDAKLRNSEEIFRLFIENAPAAMAMFDQDMRYLAVSRRWRHDYNLAGEIIGRSHYEVFPEIPPHWKEIHRLCLAGAVETSEGEYFQRADGTPQWLKWEVRPWRDTNGEIGGIVIFTEDITERMQMQKNLDEARQRLEAIVTSSTATLYVCQAFGDFDATFVSANIFNITGYTVEEFLSKGFWVSHIHPEDVPKVFQELSKLFKNKHHRHEYRFLFKDGAYHWMNDELRLIEDEAGNPTEIIGTWMEITRHKEAEKLLSISRERLHNIIQSANVGTWEWNIQTGETIFNQRWAEIVGYTLEELLPVSIQTWIDLAHPDDLPYSGELLNRHFSGESSYYDCEARMKHKDGHWVWVHDRGQVVTFTADGKPEWMYGTHTDITQRKEAELALRRQLERTALLNEIAHLTTARLDLESVFKVALGHLEEELPLDFSLATLHNSGGKGLTFAACGLKSYTLSARLGFSPGRLILLEELGLQDGLTWNKALYYPNMAQLNQPFARNLVQGDIRSVMILPLLLPDDEPQGLLLVGRSQINAFTPREQEFLGQVSEHISLAAQHARLYEQLLTAYEDLRQTQQAMFKEERLRALGQMASGIAHDINNALVPIVGFTDIILMRETNLNEASRRRIQRIKTAGQDIAHIVARLKELYRQREEQETLFPVDLNQIVPEVIELTRPQWRDIPQGKAITITVETNLAPNLPPVQSIESEVRAALTNLVINAAHAMPQGGTLTLRTGQIDQQLLVEVIDTGIGMDDETRERCLEPFYTTKGEQGTGLGLSMVYGVMQRHEGAIEIESAPGQGTTLRLLFPLRQAITPDERSGQEQEISLPSLRILCVDDDLRVRELLEEILTDEGHRVVLADGGQAGINIFQEGLAQGQPFDLVVTDLGMPYVGGREVAGAIKHASPQTPVILLSGWGRQLEGGGKIPADVDIVLGKPPTLSQIRAALVKACTTLGKGS